MAVINVIAQPKPVKKSLTWYDADGNPQTSTTANIASKNGIRIEFVVEPDYSGEIRHFDSLVYQYSTDSGATWTTVPDGTGSPATVDSNDSGSNSARVITDGASDKELDQYIQSYEIGSDVDVRVSVTDIVGYTTTIDVLTFNIADVNFNAFNLQNQETFDSAISNEGNLPGSLNLQTQETFDRAINN